MATVETRRLKSWRAWCVLSGVAGLVLLAADLGGFRAVVPRYADRYYLTYDLAPDGKRAVYGTGAGKLRLLDLATGRSRPLTLPGPADADAPRGFPAFAPDGRAVAFSATSDLWIASLDGKQARRLTDETKFSEFSPAFSPDGKTLVFARARNNPLSPTGVVFVEYDVWTVRRDGTGLRRLTNGRYRRVTGPQFTPDGKKVVFAASVRTDDLGGARDALLEADPWGAARTRPLREIDGDTAEGSGGGSYVHDPDVAPDGRGIACISDRADPYRYDVYVGSRDGAQFRPLGLNRADLHPGQPRYSKDGTRIYCLLNNTLWSVGLDGQDPRRVAPLAD